MSSQTAWAMRKRAKTSKKRSELGRLSITGLVNEKAAIRVIAPYVNIVRKGHKAAVKPEGDETHFMFYLKKKPSVLARHLTEFLDDSLDLHTLIHETVDTLKELTSAAGARVYLVDQMTNEIYLAPKQATYYCRRLSWKIQEGRTVAASVASLMEPIVVEDVAADPRFTNGVPYTDAIVKSVMCVPVVTPINTCYAVIEMFREILQERFQRAELNIAVTVANWIGAAVYMNEQKIKMSNTDQLNDCLAELIKCYFTDIRLFDKMLEELVSLTKTTLNAERATIYVIDPLKDDLVTDIIDDCFEKSDELVKRALKVRFGKDKCIARHVALSGERINLRDAPNDPRFLPEVDEKTGLITRSIICYPVKTNQGTVGVIQAINKKVGVGFSSHDEDTFNILAMYCALALQYYYVCRVNIKATARCKITLGIIKRHVLPCQHDIEYVANHLEMYENPEALRHFTWYIDQDYKDDIPQIAIYMITDIAAPESFDLGELIKYVLTLRNFYRNTPYHNYEHGFNVCHCMYNLLIRNRDRFTEIEKKALMIATLAHDVDHGGVTNNFLATIKDVMAQLYESAIWENHHFEVTMMILSEIHVFKDVTPEEYAQLTATMKHAIISTDLAYYFKIRSEAASIIIGDKFDWNSQDHKLIALSVMMTICDLSGQCKPFKVAKRLTENLYNEFYLQGDREKALGLQPLSLMDREKQFFQPEDQIVFLNVLVLPAAELVGKILNDCWDLYDVALSLRADWEEVVTIRDGRCWRQQDSIVPDQIQVGA
ncbi:hypothetical protein Trydic_g19372 [Trypoxylus dichotomus]